MRLREILEERDIKQKDFAAKLNLAKSTMNNYVQGNREPDYETLGQICDALGVTADYLLGRSTNPAPAVSDEDAALLRAYHSAPPSIVAGIQALLQPYTEEKAKADQAV